MENHQQDLHRQSLRFMQVITVTYTVKPEFVAENQANIQRVMESLCANPIDGVHYVAFMKEDGQTFVHINMVRDDQSLNQFTELEEFKAFQQALRNSGPLSPPTREDLALVGAGYAI